MAVLFTLRLKICQLVGSYTILVTRISFSFKKPFFRAQHKGVLSLQSSLVTKIVYEPFYATNNSKRFWSVSWASVSRLPGL
jgi:hypothetical protein